MKKLILVGGTMGVGKTTVCRELQQLLPRNVFLDGDWCWNMRPFVVNDETRTMVMNNICDLLGRFIACSAYENIIFCWVMHRQEIIDEILSRLDLADVKVYSISLMAGAATLTGRIRGDILKGVRCEEDLKKSLSYLPGYAQLDTIKIDTDHLSIRNIARQIEKRTAK